LSSCKIIDINITGSSLFYSNLIREGSDMGVVVLSYNKDVSVLVKALDTGANG
jgi:FixJ family two-component response regulator